MTEEIIIINGVNVAGCVRLQDDKISCDLGGECKGWENCYYKQLKHLEQERDELKENYKEDHAELLMARSEIESLKSDLEEFARRTDFAGKENDKLKQENRELKEKYSHVLELAKTNADSNEYCLQELEQENETLKNRLSGKEKQLQENIDCVLRKKDEIKTLRYMLYEEKEIPKDKFVMMYRIAQNERKTRQHKDLCINLVNKYKLALKEIRENLVKLKTNDEDDFTYEYSKIEDKINEVLDES